MFWPLLFHVPKLTTSTVLVNMLPDVGDAVKVVLANVDEPGALCDLVASRLNLKVEERQEALEALDVKERLHKVTKLLAREMEFVEVAQRIQTEAKSEIDKSQREYYLRQQLKTIQQELGETDAQATEVAELREQLEAKKLPEEARKEAERELDRLARINPASPEYSVARTYLDSMRHGVSRVFWYGWDIHVLGTDLTARDGSGAVTAGGLAFQTTQAWMAGGRWYGCRTRSRVTTCTIRQRDGAKVRIRYASRTRSYRVPRGTSTIEFLDGSVKQVSSGQRIRLTTQPVLMR